MAENENIHYLEPTQEAGRAFLTRKITGSVVMLNLLRFRRVADYSATPHLAPQTPISGAAAYQLYIDHTLPFLEAMNFYVSLFPNSRIVSIDRYGPGEPGKEGTVKIAVFELSSTRLICIDSPAQHAFTFTPSVSLFVDCDRREELDRLFASLSAEGQVLMPPDSYGFSRWFAWVQDRFGVSWQLNRP